MVKKLIAVAAFSGSMLIGVPAANANPGLCVQHYNLAIAACAAEGEGFGSPCEISATMALQDCLQRDVVEHS
ncbi:hypothetical protein [Brevundimonas sp.]|uniref:hypothetical protein n=1 Tax=Brevundimonas sp. TaxID=1871086 RepID=UPI001ACE51C2|nr:hypothetical protein [Brevundimonas sp.]MBN9467030.1 hypothetical protein [Brevundimonas sp.]